MIFYLGSHSSLNTKTLNYFYVWMQRLFLLWNKRDTFVETKEKKYFHISKLPKAFFKIKFNKTWGNFLLFIIVIAVQGGDLY